MNQEITGPTSRARRVRLAVGVPLLAVGLVAAFSIGPGTARAARTSPTAWTSPTAIPATNSYGWPAMAAFNGKLYAAWTGAAGMGSVHVWYSAFNGTSWSTPAKVPLALTIQYTAPVLGAYNGSLYVAWIGSTSPYQQLWYSSFNGSTWTSQKRGPVGAHR
jgi:hypothetical protein